MYADHDRLVECLAGAAVDRGWTCRRWCRPCRRRSRCSPGLRARRACARGPCRLSPIILTPSTFLASAMNSQMSSSGMPSKIGVATLKPSALAATPRWVSSTWPTFIREGTPSGLRQMSTGVPSSRKGMSSSGTMVATTPLLPWRPAILSPTRELALGGDEDLDLLDDAGIDLVAALELVELALALGVEFAGSGPRRSR